MHGLLCSIFRNMEQENIDYCLMRDYDQLDQLATGGEIDLLVQSQHFARLNNLLARFGFVRLPDWGHTPHHFFIGYDQDIDCWFKLDIVTEVAYGQPIHSLRTTLADNCLRNRQRAGFVFIPSPEDELMTLLLHCVIDKGHFAPARRHRLQALRHQITEEHYLSVLVGSFWVPAMTWAQVAAMIDSENWELLLSSRQEVAAHLASRNRLAAVHEIRDRILRKLNNWIYGGRPKSLTVTLLAPDGAGKSTLAAGIQNSFHFPVHSIYMGLYQKRAEAPILALLPGFSFAGRLFKQWGRYLIARYHQARGRLIIFDRYTYDASLPPPQPLNWVKRCRRWLLAHACPAPDLVLMLDAPGDVLYARKGEHSPAFLEQQRQSYLRLRAYLPQMIVIDATRDAEFVRREAISWIWRGYLSRQMGLKVNQAVKRAPLPKIESSRL